MQALESSVCSRDPRRPRARAHVRRCRILCIGYSRVLSAASHSSGCALIPLQTSFSSFVSRPCGRIGSTFDYHRGTLFRMMVSLDDSFEVHEGEGCNVAFTHVGEVSVRSSIVQSFLSSVILKWSIWYIRLIVTKRIRRNLNVFLSFLNIFQLLKMNMLQLGKLEKRIWQIR